ncbi:amine oxidase [Pseudovirgaria hyperparasitica]|uniref:Amine oxidase n=1 Tax=Pseudovirgaria hyperparasitica TaxID=470096 RepID=A0A6A6VXM5_9PEZI|nr:amine oxidase [Pseudovirgaria hyperparasitica]KAF2754444.1 amine oxidase [Pseudovirgaria hyperparasitica]
MFDIIIVGAGLSGLQSALSAQEAGLTVAVVEARDRLGGKVWSVPLASGRGVVDLGAAWVNDSMQKRVWRYTQMFGLDVVRQRLEGQAVMIAGEGEGGRVEFPFGIMPEFSAAEKRDLERVRDHIQAESMQTGLPSQEQDAVTLDQYVRDLGARPKTRSMVNLWSQVMHGVESSEQSAAFFIDYCRRNHGLLAIRADDRTGGQYLRYHQGTSAIVEGIAGLVGHANIHLSSPVASIQDHGGHVSVITTNGNTFQGKKCILSLPTTLYKDINILPPLPPRAQEVYNSTRLGDYNKAIVCYDRPWWRDQGYNGFFMSFNGPVNLARDTSVDEKRQFSLTCFVNGQFGRDWSRLRSHERRKVVLEQLAKVYKVDRDSEVWRPIEIFDQVWMEEKFSKGALTPITAVGHLTKFVDVYGKPVGNLHFVGTEFATEWKGYMEGALETGERAVREVMNMLGPRSTL